MKKTALPILVPILCLLLPVLAGCFSRPDGTASDAEPEQAHVPYTETVQSRDVTDRDGRLLVKCTLVYPEFESDALNGIVSAFVRSFSDAAAASASEVQAYDPGPYEFSYACRVKACNEKMVSLSIEEYIYQGGAHGRTDFYGLVLDPVTGAAIPPAELLGMDGDEAKEAVRQAFRELILSDAEHKCFFPNANELLDGILETGMPTYYADGGEVIFILQTYEIAGNAAGPQSVSLPLGGAYAE